MTKESQRSKIMMAAEKLFADRRIHEVTLDEVAQEARVGKGTIYRHFSDKDDLFFQTAISGFEELCDLLRRKIPDRADFEDLLSTACIEISTFFDRRQQMFRMIQMEEGRVIGSKGSIWERWLAKRQLLVETLKDILDRGRQSGAIRLDVDLGVLANVLLGLLRTRRCMMNGSAMTAKEAGLVRSLFLHGASGPSHKS